MQKHYIMKTIAKWLRFIKDRQVRCIAMAKNLILLSIEKRLFFTDFKYKLMILNSHLKRILQKFTARKIYQ